MGAPLILAALQVRELRARAAELPPDYFVVLVGDMVTEEALPTYMAMLNTLDGVRDESGSDPGPWARWTRCVCWGVLCDVYVMCVGRWGWVESGESGVEGRVGGAGGVSAGLGLLGSVLVQLLCVLGLHMGQGALVLYYPVLYCPSVALAALSLCRPALPCLPAGSGWLRRTGMATC